MVIFEKSVTYVNSAHCYCLPQASKNLAMPLLIDSAYQFYHTCNFMLLQF